MSVSLISCQSDQKRLNQAVTVQQISKEVDTIRRNAEKAEVDAAKIPKPPAVCAQIVKISAERTDSYQIVANKLLVGLDAANSRIRYCYNWVFKIYKDRANASNP